VGHFQFAGGAAKENATRFDHTVTAPTPDPRRKHDVVATTGAGRLAPRGNDDDAHGLADKAPAADATITVSTTKAAVAPTPADTGTRNRNTK
jgi:hypothetical protein